MSWIPKPQEIYKHFKGNLYQIITLAQDSENGQMMVVYQALYGDFKVYVRPLEMFTGKVDTAKYPNVAQEYRFERQSVSWSPADAPQQAGAVPEAETPQQAGAAPAAGVPRQADAAPEAEAQMAGVRQPGFAPAERAPRQESTLDPLVWEFLDADSHEKRLNILAALHHRITDDMITTMAVACDVEVPDGDVEERYSQLKNCLIMLDRFEIKRK